MVYFLYFCNLICNLIGKIRQNVFIYIVMGVKTKTSFSTGNQPVKRRGRKKGIKIGNIYLNEQIEKFTGEDITQYTPLTVKHILKVCNLLLLQDETVSKEILKDPEAPNMLKAVIGMLLDPKYAMDIIWWVIDKTIQLEGTDTEGLTINYNRVKLKEKDATN